MVRVLVTLICALLLLLMLTAWLCSRGLSGAYTFSAPGARTCELGINYGRVYVAIKPGGQHGLIVDGANFRNLTQNGFGLLGVGFSRNGNTAWGGGMPVLSIPLWLPMLL